MHDWTLVSILTEWSNSTVIVQLRDRHSAPRKLTAHGIRGLSVRQDQPWGSSVSILACEPVIATEDGLYRLTIELQSGDRIDIEAERFDLPHHAGCNEQTASTMSDAGQSLERLPSGTRWPGGDGRDAALLDIEATELSRRLGCALDHGDESGLGPWQGIGLRLPSGIHVGLIGHRFAPKRGFVLQVDSAADLAAAIEETLTLLGLERGALLWRSPLVPPRD